MQSRFRSQYLRPEKYGSVAFFLFFFEILMFFSLHLQESTSHQFPQQLEKVPCPNISVREELTTQWRLTSPSTSWRNTLLMRVVAFSPMTGRSTSVTTSGRRCGYREDHEDIPMVPHGLADISAESILKCPYGNTEHTSGKAVYISWCSIIKWDGFVAQKACKFVLVWRVFHLAAYLERFLKPMGFFLSTTFPVYHHSSCPTPVFLSNTTLPVHHRGRID